MTFLSIPASYFLGGEGHRGFVQPLKHLESNGDLRGGLPALFIFRCYLAVGVLPNAADLIKSFFSIYGY